MENLPLYVSIVFGIAVLLSCWFFYKGSRSPLFLFVVAGWIIIQSVLSFRGFYSGNTARFPLLAAPPLLTIILLFATKKGRNFIDSLDAKWLTWLHLVRIPVELSLLWLFLAKQVPQLMTFEGRNFDILSGITAPFVAYFGFHKKKLGTNLILIWNFICLGLLINIVANAILSAPFPIQQFAFDQPNVAIFYFPFVLLPALVVPLVLLSHLAVIRRELRRKN